MSLARAAFVVSALLFGGCNGADDGVKRVERNTDFDQNKDLFKELQRAEHLICYEGLPHPDEGELLAAEKHAKATRTLHGFLFYRDSLAIHAGDEVKVKRLLGNESSFEKSGGLKLCGGFHPDYCLEWRIDDAVYRVLICFGCEEINVYSPDRSLFCDVRKETVKELRAILHKYRKNRPSNNSGAK